MQERISYKRNDIWPIVYDFFLRFKNQFPNIKCNIVGSIRREKQEIHDFDIIIASKEEKIKEWCYERINCKRFSSPLFPYSFDMIQGELENIKTQIWFCVPEEYGPHLLLKTGPLTFNLTLASIAKNKGLTLSEHGLFRGTPENRGERIDENTEANIIWLLLGCKWIHPKDRY